MKRVLVFLFVLIVTLSSAGQEKKPNILLISLDTFRADKLQPYGAKNDIAPFLNKFAKEARVYVNSSTPSPLTLPAHATLLTGSFPSGTALYDNGVGTLSPSVRTVAETLRDGGYITRAIVSASVLRRRFGLSRGFDIYDDAIGPDERRWGGEVTEPARIFLKESKTKPFFLWVHYFDTHSPYFALSGDEPIVDDYDKAVTYVDSQVGQLLEALPPNTITIIVSDHGEALGDHGEPTHGLLLYQPTTSVVLMVKGDKLQPALVKEFRTLADVAPTIYKLAGIEGRKCDGTHLDVAGKRVLPLSNLLPLNTYRWKPLFGATDGRYKWIRGDKLRLFDLEKDPGETVEISSLATKEAADLKKAIPTFETAFAAMKSGSFSGLGYLTGVPKDPLDIDKLQDPEKMLKVFEQIERMRKMRDNQEWEQSVALLKEVLPQDPGNPSLLFSLGDSLWRAGRPEEALAPLDKSLAISPSLLPSWIAKGNVYAASERREEAAKCFEKALACDEDSIEALNSLAANYLDMDKPELAFPLLERAVARGLADAATFVMQGRIHLFQKKFDIARQDFNRAMEVATDPKGTRKAIADKYLLYHYNEVGVKYLKDGIALYPDYSPNYLTLGAFYLSIEDYPSALDIFEKALKTKLSSEERKNVAEIVEDLRKGLNAESK